LPGPVTTPNDLGRTSSNTVLCRCWRQRQVCLDRCKSYRSLLPRWQAVPTADNLHAHQGLTRCIEPSVSAGSSLWESLKALVFRRPFLCVQNRRAAFGRSPKPSLALASFSFHQHRPLKVTRWHRCRPGYCGGATMNWKRPHYGALRCRIVATRSRLTRLASMRLRPPIKRCTTVCNGSAPPSPTDASRPKITSTALSSTLFGIHLARCCPGQPAVNQTASVVVDVRSAQSYAS
jgi:hypothetical protein